MNYNMDRKSDDDRVVNSSSSVSGTTTLEGRSEVTTTEEQQSNQLYENFEAMELGDDINDNNNYTNNDTSNNINTSESATSSSLEEFFTELNAASKCRSILEHIRNLSPDKVNILGQYYEWLVRKGESLIRYNEEQLFEEFLQSNQSNLYFRRDLDYDENDIKIRHSMYFSVLDRYLHLKPFVYLS